MILDFRQCVRLQTQPQATGATASQIKVLVALFLTYIWKISIWLKHWWCLQRGEKSKRSHHLGAVTLFKHHWKLATKNLQQGTRNQIRGNSKYVALKETVMNQKQVVQKVICSTHVSLLMVTSGRSTQILYSSQSMNI